MQEAAASSKQMMASVVGLQKDTLSALCDECAGSGGTCSIANFLFSNGFSCAGSKDAIEKLIEKAQATEGCLSAKALKTSGAFHSKFMEPARLKLLEALKGVQGSMQPPKCDVYMNKTGT